MIEAQTNQKEETYAEEKMEIKINFRNKENGDSGPMHKYSEEM